VARIICVAVATLANEKRLERACPLLFNFFIDDLENSLMHNCNTNPVVIGDVSLNILLYADDIVSWII
jgi:hypothetical protein